MANSQVQTIISVGIDIGTTTTQLAISRLTIENTAPASALPRMEITKREVLYRSGIHFTPLKDIETIDATAVYGIVDRECRAAGLTAAGIDTGAVIITGETAKKENARSILEALAGMAGDFVVATAGPHLESILAGKGSGAAAYSGETHRITANIDVGGGTSNIAVFKEGRVVDTACINIGGHLIQIKPEGDEISYIAGPARAVLNECGLPLVVGQKVELQQLKVAAGAMAGCVEELFSPGSLSPITRKLLMTPPLKMTCRPEKIMFSGGVADYVYGDFHPASVSEVSLYGDIGPLLGRALKEAFGSGAFSLARPAETIRATVIGAGAQSVNLSGSTIKVSENNLPLRNLMVINPFTEEIPETGEEIAEVIRDKVTRLTGEGSAHHPALALKGPRTPAYKDVQTLAKGIVMGMGDSISQQYPLVVLLEDDCGKVLGQCLQIMLGEGAGVVCVDQVAASVGDYVDIGRPLLGGRVVPVVVKTLFFS